MDQESIKYEIVRLRTPLHDRVWERAKAEKRTLTAQLELIVEKGLALEQQETAQPTAQKVKK